MRLLARYLVRECLVALAYCFTAFLILWVALDLFGSLHDFQEDKLRAGDIAEYYFFRLPEFLPVALPVALLLALLYAITNHARHNEITAIRAAGVSLWRLSLPYIGIGSVAAVTLFLLNEFCAPLASDVAEQIRDRRVKHQLSAAERQQDRNKMFHNSVNDRFWWAGVYNVESGEMFQLAVDWPDADGTRRRLFADHGVYSNGVWTFYHVRELKQYIGTNALSVRLPQTNCLTMPEFTEKPEEITSALKIMDQHDHPTKTHRADIPITEFLKYLRLNPHPDGPMRAWLYTKMYGRFAGPFTCVVVVFIAVPFAAGPGRRNVFVGVAASIVVFFAYYLLQQIGFAFGEAGNIPAWLGAWFPNLLFGTAGLCMMLRIR